MSENENGNLRADGFSVAIPFTSYGGTYYWNPGSPTAPSVTLTRGLGGMGGGGAQSVFLRKGMTSQDTLGYGANLTLPFASVNASIPDDHGIPQPWNARVSSIESGLVLPGFGLTYTSTPQQVAAGIANLLRPITPAMGPNDELSPFERRLQSGQATVGSNGAPPVGYLSSPFQMPTGNVQNPLGNGMGDWRSSVSGINPQNLAQQDLSQERPGGLPGLLWDYLQNK